MTAMPLMPTYPKATNSFLPDKSIAKLSLAAVTSMTLFALYGLQ